MTIVFFSFWVFFFNTHHILPFCCFQNEILLKIPVKETYTYQNCWSSMGVSQNPAAHMLTLK